MMPSIGTAKAPHAKSLLPSRARLATCLLPGGMSRLRSVICFCCSGCLRRDNQDGNPIQIVALQLLEHLRYRTDRGYVDAAKLIADFQADVVAQVEAGNVDGRMLAFVGGALHQSKIPASPELAAASARQPVDPDEDGPLPTDVHAALAGILEACDGDPFLAVGSLIESGHAMPAESCSALAVGLALAGIPEARGATFFSCSTQIRLCAGRLPVRLRRSPPR